MERISTGMTKLCGGGHRCQKFVPSTIMLKVMSVSSWFCAVRSLKELVRSLLIFMSAYPNVSQGNYGLKAGDDEFTCTHALKLVRIL